MRCERCGKELTNRIIKINGVTYCDNCARIMGYDRYLRDPADLLGNPFAPLDQIATSLLQMNELDFGNSTLKCPKCGMTLREFENEGRVGCIECYNTFNENIVREMFKQQGNSEYAGRLPNQPADVDVTSDEVIMKRKLSQALTQVPDAPAKTEEITEKKEEKKPEIKAEKGALTIDQLKKADLGMLSDEDLEKGIKVAAEAEEYILASKLRDELKGRKEGGANG
jgi:protein-arginine kinase activator protein McsA